MNKSVHSPLAAKKHAGVSAPAANSDTKTLSGSNAAIYKLAGLVLAAVFSWYIYSSGSSSILNLSKATEAELREALFKPHKPYIFYCIKGIKGDDLKNVPAVYKELHAARGNKYTFALLDCNKKMDAPSGSWTKAERKAIEEAAEGADGKTAAPAPPRKSVFEIYKVNRKIKPTVFVTAPWTHPQLGGPGTAKQVPDGQLGDMPTLRKYVDTALRPRAVAGSTDSELARLCGWGKHARAPAGTSADAVGATCIALVKGKRHGKEQLELEEKLIREFPQNRYISVPAAKQSIRLTMNAADAEVPSDSYALQIHALRNNSHYLSMSTPVSWDYVKTFVSRATSAPLDDYSAAGPAGITFGAGEKSSSFKKRVPKAYAPPSAEPTEGSGGSGTSGTAAMTPEEIAAAKAAKERRAREAMDRQASEANIEEVGEGEGDEDDEEEGDEEEEGEDMVEL